MKVVKKVNIKKMVKTMQQIAKVQSTTYGPDRCPRCRFSDG